MCILIDQLHSYQIIVFLLVRFGNQTTGIMGRVDAGDIKPGGCSIATIGSADCRNKFVDQTLADILAEVLLGAVDILNIIKFNGKLTVY